MRRKHCKIETREEMEAILNDAQIGRMATVDRQGYPYITPVNFVYHQGRIFFHCALKGEKMENIARDPRVGFEVDIPLAYLDVSFNPERHPCFTHQFYRSVVIRGRARLLPDGPFKAEALNALVAKHEGHSDFPPVTEDTPNARICGVVEITPEWMTGKADLAQNKDQDGVRKDIARHLAKRGLPGDLAAVRAMGYRLDGNEIK